MIEIFEGRLGGGKSYSAVVRAVDQIRRGGMVCTNIALKWEAVSAYVSSVWGVAVQPEQLIVLSDEEIGLFHRHTPTGTPSLPVLVIIDEAHLNFNARDWSQSSRELLAFLTQSRKVFTDVIFISQSALNLDKQFMRLVQYIWRFRDLSKWRIPALNIPWPMNQILCVQYDYDGQTMLSRSFVRKDTRIFKLYDTHSLLRIFPRIDVPKTTFQLQKTVTKNNKMKYLIPIMIAAGIFAAYKIYHQLRDVKPLTSISSPSLPSQSKASPIRSESVKPSYSIWPERFTGYMPPKTVITSKGEYSLGEMSLHGMVLAVRPGVVKVIQPDGSFGFVVPGDDSQKREVKNRE